MVYGSPGGDVAKLWGQSRGNRLSGEETSFPSEPRRNDGTPPDAYNGSSNSPERSQAGFKSVQKSTAKRSRT